MRILLAFQKQVLQGPWYMKRNEAAYHLRALSWLGFICLPDFWKVPRGLSYKDTIRYSEAINEIRIQRYLIECVPPELDSPAPINAIEELDQEGFDQEETSTVEMDEFAQPETVTETITILGALPAPHLPWLKNKKYLSLLRSPKPPQAVSSATGDTELTRPASPAIPFSRNDATTAPSSTGTSNGLTSTALTPPNSPPRVNYNLYGGIKKSESKSSIDSEVEINGTTVRNLAFK